MRGLLFLALYPKAKKKNNQCVKHSSFEKYLLKTQDFVGIINTENILRGLETMVMHSVVKEETGQVIKLN